ncbi:serine/threonine protein kinase [Hyalangium rubrum]|uniref:Serine/threonine-protein kinase n=1 Tax=Hyalangium rubrum TaxID=3103134 RepID=A0ABU5HEZ0_9BACT|nr:serine/threonine-protein kinase [Hyalangium sp. s54d21]MDY7231926.1 serine/threonine-protein kinase [Hyalangium sp. s54d21]
MTKTAGPRSPLPGEMLGQWKLIDRAGRGSFGVVFRAQLTAEPATVAALKLAREPMDARFEREAKLLDSARSPHLPRLLDKGEWLSPDGQSYPYLVMQWVEGLPLYAWRNSQGLSNASAARALAHVAHALAELHRIRGVHRDVKGDNVLVNSEGQAVLVDLGAAWHVGARPLTDTVIPPGTEVYRSPELLRFRRQFRRTPEAHYISQPADDLYALGVTAYRLVTGTYPGPLTNPDTSSAEPSRFLPPRELATVTPELERLIFRMLSEKSEERGTAAELAQALEQAAINSGAAPLTKRPSMMQTQKTSRPGPRSHLTVPVWLSWVGSSAIAASLALVVWMVATPPQPPKTMELAHAEEEEAQNAGAPEERLTGLADAGVGEVYASTAALPSAGVPTYAIGLPMPTKPFPGQRKPPCRPRSEVEIHGACWVRLDIKPPCGNEGFEWGTLCVVAAFDGPKSNTSEHP